jgi:ribose transport system substrate-binding protein
MNLPTYVSSPRTLSARLLAVLGAGHESRQATLRWRRAAALVVATALPVVVAACGSNGTSGSSSSDSTQSASGNQTGATASQVAKAKAYIARYASPPTNVTVTTPVLKHPTPGRTVVYLQCAGPQCAEAGDAMANAAAAVGWQFKRIDFDTTNPATLIAAMKKALQYNPVGVAFQAVPYALWASQVPAYTAAHVALVPSYVGATPSNPIIAANIGGNNVIEANADLIANWFIADSHGTGKALLYSVPDFPALLQVQTDFLAAVKAGCTGCSVQLVNGTPTQVAAGGVNAAIVAALRRDSSLQYMIMSDYPLTVGLPAALKAAGISGIKIGGIYAGAADQTLIKQGQEAAGTPQPENIPGWLTIDAMIRYSEGMSNNDGDDILPLQLLTPSTVGEPTNSYDFPANYQQLFKRLWLAG